MFSHLQNTQQRSPIIYFAHGRPFDSCLYSNTCAPGGYPKMNITQRHHNHSHNDVDEDVNNNQQKQPVFLFDWIHISVCCFYIVTFCFVLQVFVAFIVHVIIMLLLFYCMRRYYRRQLDIARKSGQAGMYFHMDDVCLCLYV
jgi:hypothetical protein